MRTIGRAISGSDYSNRGLSQNFEDLFDWLADQRNALKDWRNNQEEESTDQPEPRAMEEPPAP